MRILRGLKLGRVHVVVWQIVIRSAQSASFILAGEWLALDHYCVYIGIPAK